MAPEPDAGQDATELDEAIAAVIQAAQSQGFDLPAEGVSPEQLPQVYQQLLQAAAQSEMGATDNGIALIERLAQTLGIPSPFGEQQDGDAPDYVFGGEEPQPLQEAPGRAPGAMPPPQGRRRY